MPKRNLIWIVAIIVAALVVVWITRNGYHTAYVSGDDSLNDVRDAYRRIYGSYYRAVDANALRQGAVRGMVAELDEYSHYVPPGQAETFDARLDGRQCGTGLCLADDGEGRVVVVGATVGSSACNSDLRSGDVIVKVDRKSVRGMTAEQVDHLLPRVPDKTVQLTVHGKAGRSRSVTLGSDTFDVMSVGGLCRDGHGRWVHAVDPAAGIAYIRISEFVPDTPLQFDRAFGQLKQPRGLVLDLRGNPGGQASAASAVVDRFLRSGAIMTEVTRDDRRETRFAHPEGTYPDIPVIVLIDENTASGAEIVSGALKLHGRAVLVGTRTRGKGCVQKGFDLSGNLGKIYLTVEEYFVGEDHPISRLPGHDTWGVDPHVRVPMAPEYREELQRLRRQVVAIPLPLPRADEPGLPEARENMLRILELDMQLARAVNLLKFPKEMDRLLHPATAPATKPATK